MKTERWMERSLGCLACLLIFHMTGSAFARPRPPGPPYPETGVLTTLRFDNPNQITNASLFLQDLALVESWSGYALSMEGKEPKLFVIPAVDEKGKTNLTSTAGTIRFWFKPSWASSTTGGNGPGSAARLFEVGAWTEKLGVGWWSLQFSPAGDAISFVAQSKGECLDILKTSIQWREGEWHQVAFSYSPKGSWLFLDGRLAAEGQAVALVPLEKINAVLGFCLGSDAQGLELAQGQFDEVLTFKFVENSDHAAWGYSCLAGAAALGPITPEEDAARLASLTSARTGKMTGLQTMMQMDGGPTLPPSFGGTPGAPVTNWWVWSGGLNHGTNLCFFSIGCLVTNQTTNVYLTITNNISTNSYDLYVSTNLNSVPFWGGVTQGIAWSFLANLAAGVTSLTLSNVTNTASFYAMAMHWDSDGDGLSDGDEFFLYKTNPLNDDTDGDGLKDGWERMNGLNPLVDDSAQHDSRMNYTFDEAGCLLGVSGARTESFTLDPEGNIQNVSQ